MASLMLIDSASLAYRAWFGMINRPEAATNADGKPVGVIIGWVNSIMELRTRFPADLIIAVFEDGICHHRVNIHPTYKAHRAERPEGLSIQFPQVRELSEALGISTISSIGFEADDIIAHLAVQWVEQDSDNQVLLVSSDKDFNCLLISDRITILRPGSGSKEWTKVRGFDVITKYGVDPTMFIDFLALTGDVADGYAGVPQIGPVRAVKLLTQVGGCQAILESKSKSPLVAIVQQHRNVLIRNLKLIRYMEMPESVTVPDQQSGNYGRALEILRDLKLGNAMAKVVDARDADWFGSTKD
jgi:DNA polymerase-1